MANERPGMPPAHATAPPASSSPERECTVARLFDAPRDRVFSAWTEPALLTRWWGPKGFTTPVCRIDLRPGGAWRIVMRSPQGIDYPLKGIYVEVVRPERLVMTVDLHEHPGEWHAMLNEYRKDAQGNPMPELLWTVTFEEHGPRTRLTIASRFESTEERGAMLKMGMIEGWSQSLERLEELLG